MVSVGKQERDPRASRAGHPGEGVEPICVPGWREGGELSDEELRDGLVALAAIAQSDDRDRDADILLEALDRIEGQSAVLERLGKTGIRVTADDPPLDLTIRLEVSP